MARPLLAQVRVVRRAHRGGDPHPPLVIEHRVVDVVPARPEDFIAPVGRGLRHLRIRRLGIRVPDRQLDLARRVVRRIQHGEVIGAQLQRTVDRSVGVDGGVPPVGRDLVVQIGLRVGPVPLGDDDVPLEALGPRRRRRHFAGGDPIGPVREHRERPPAQLVGPGQHVSARLSGEDPPLPRCGRGIEGAERPRDLPRRLVPQLMAGPAAAGLQVSQPLGLAADLRRDVAPRGPRAVELALVRHAEQGKPVAGRVVLCRRARAGRRDRVEVEHPAGHALDLRRIHEPVTAHPYAVGRFRKVGHHVTPPVVGDHDPDELRRELGRLRDHPHAGLGPARAAHDAPDVVVVDRDRLVRGGRARSGSRQQGDDADGETETRPCRGWHAYLSLHGMSSRRTGHVRSSLLRGSRPGRSGRRRRKLERDRR